MFYPNHSNLVIFDLILAEGKIQESKFKYFSKRPKTTIKGLSGYE